MVPDRIEGRAMAHLTGLWQKKTVMAGGKPVSPVFGTLTLVIYTFLFHSSIFMLQAFIPVEVQ